MVCRVNLMYQFSVPGTRVVQKDGRRAEGVVHCVRTYMSRTVGGKELGLSPAAIVNPSSLSTDIQKVVGVGFDALELGDGRLWDFRGFYGPRAVL